MAQTKSLSQISEQRAKLIGVPFDPLNNDSVTLFQFPAVLENAVSGTAKTSKRMVVAPKDAAFHVFLLPLLYKHDLTFWRILLIERSG